MFSSQGGGGVNDKKLVRSYEDVVVPQQTPLPLKIPSQPIDTGQHHTIAEVTGQHQTPPKATDQHQTPPKATGEQHTPPLSTPSQHSPSTQHKETQDSLRRLSLMTCRKLTFSVHLLVALVMAQVSLTAGIAFGFTGITLPQLTDQNGDDLYLTPQQAILFGSLFSAGAMFGSIMCGQVMVRLGQRTTQLIGMITFVVGWCTLALTLHVSVLISCMFVLGIAYTLIKNAVATYALEVTHEKHRGLISAFSMMGNYLGSALPTYIGMTGITWRQLAFASCGPILVTIIGVLFLPNSPRWLVTRNRINDAKKALMFFRGSHQSIETELAGIIAQVNSNKAVNVLHQMKLLFQPKTRRIFCFQLIVTFLMPITGSPTVQAYLMVVMQGMEVDFDPNVSAAIFSALQLFGLLILLFLIDKVGRKPLLVVSLALNSVSFMSFTISSYLSKTYTIDFLLWVPLVSTLAGSFSYGIYTPVYYTLRAELLPTSSRAVGVNVLECIFFFGLFLATWSYLIVVQNFGQLAAFGVFSGCSAVLVPIVAFALPETKRRSLEEICT